MTAVRKNALAQGGVVLFIVGVSIGAVLVFYEPDDPSDNLLQLFGLAAIFAPMVAVAGAALLAVALSIGEQPATSEDSPAADEPTENPTIESDQRGLG